MTADGAADWPVDLRGVTESVVATLGPNDLWNLAALGLHAPTADGADAGRSDGAEGLPGAVRARTWGRTRTRRNFEARGEGVVQFVTDPRDFVDAAATVREEPDPVLDSADAWARVAVERVRSGSEGDTEWVDWHLRPTEAAVEHTGVRTINRGFGAVVEATVAASRLDVPGYESSALVDRLACLESVVDRCGGAPEREAFERLSKVTGWRDRR
ncbi:DUF447 domain-containing protein [Halorarum salinum]|uniref:DUF447 family protein n=1 Tax=Halorarum salinum TaxID=2743089 RepID=A0A7D5LCI5_9EURY|nr:DUF447 domain-containing protein [Halobaculum salinum]QLG62729.1 DUF447 family protein [Halobaculum salinum]